MSLISASSESLVAFQKIAIEDAKRAISLESLPISKTLVAAMKRREEESTGGKSEQCWMCYCFARRMERNAPGVTLGSNLVPLQLRG